MLKAAVGKWGYGSERSISFAQEHSGSYSSYIPPTVCLSHYSDWQQPRAVSWAVCPAAQGKLAESRLDLSPAARPSYALSKPSTWVSRCTSVQRNNSSGIHLFPHSIFIIPEILITSASGVVVYFIPSPLGTDFSNAITSSSKTPQNLSSSLIATAKIPVFV